MAYRLAADLVLVLHLLFIAFVMCGGLLALRSLHWGWLHLPATAWGIWIEWSGGLCPLTPLENRFRQLASGEGYQGGFIEHYLVPLIYPGQLNDSVQWLLGVLVLLVNLAVYALVLGRRRNHPRPG